MDQIKRLLAGLLLRQKISIAAAAALVISLMMVGVRWNKERDLRPLYSNLSPEDAGAVVERLKSSSAGYKVQENGTILVPSARVAELRLELAASGLPKTGRIGFELFDKTNLGATDFAEHVNFRRAIEGELERSVMSIGEVERARVHVTFAKDSVFLENRQPAKASIMVKLRPGSRLPPQKVLAVQHLAASAVEGLNAELVSVLDMNGNLLGRPRQTQDPEAGAGSAMQEYRQAVEKDFLLKVKATLDPLLGEEKYRVGISAECDFSSGEQSEETFDPGRSVMASSQKTEDSSGAAATGGVPGAASNLPRPAPRAGTLGGGVSRKTENITYQTSRVVKRMKLPQGNLKRLSVAVLVDHNLRWEGSGPKARRILEPLAPEKLKVVRDVIAGVVGFREDRGDQILVETLPFEATLTMPPPDADGAPRPAGPGGITLPAWLAPLLKKAPVPVWVGAVAALIIVFGAAGWLVFRRFRRTARKRAGEVRVGAPAVAGAQEAAGQIPAGSPLPDYEGKAMAMLAENEAERERQELETIASLRLLPQTKKGEVLRKVISDQARKDPAAVAQLLRTWLTEPNR